MPPADWRPPAPPLRSSVAVGLKIFFERAPDLLQTLPRSCYERDVVAVPIGRRPVFIVNHPDLVRRIFIDDRQNYPKSDLMVDGLRPLLGDGVLISGGDTWEHDRAMLEPAFMHMRLEQVFPKMQLAVRDFTDRLAAVPAGSVLDLEAELSRVTADIMFRAMFSQPIDAGEAAQVFQSFTRFQQSVPQFDLRVVLASHPDRPPELPPALLEEAARIRGLLARLLERRLAELDAGQRFVDFAQAVIDARDADGRAFTRTQVIDQLAVFFLAGHETTASSLAWAFFLLSCQPAVRQRLRSEIQSQLGERAFDFHDLKELPAVRSVFRETLRLYPPVAFLTRRALRGDRFGRCAVPAGSFVVVSPWLLHRHRGYWRDADCFDPSRFESPGGGARAGTYIPFGLGPRVCTGATIAQLEASLILCEVLRRHDVQVLDPDRVFPGSRVTIRPVRRMQCRLSPAD
ncbi:MAG: cytochrome P450 [Burkholderiaceae bacterium]|nr:cytochrome P450 [Burkholderiaceae bacterium]